MKFQHIKHFYANLFVNLIYFHTFEVTEAGKGEKLWQLDAHIRTVIWFRIQFFGIQKAYENGGTKYRIILWLHHQINIGIGLCIWLLVNKHLQLFFIYSSVIETFFFNSRAIWNISPFILSKLSMKKPASIYHIPYRSQCIIAKTCLYFIEVIPLNYSIWWNWIATQTKLLYYSMLDFFLFHLNFSSIIDKIYKESFLVQFSVQLMAIPIRFRYSNSMICLNMWYVV